MIDRYGSDFITIEDEDGTEYELEVLTTVEYNGCSYLAVIPAGESTDEFEIGVTILKSTEEDGEAILSVIEDDEELEAIHDVLMDSLYDDEVES